MSDHVCYWLKGDFRCRVCARPFPRMNNDFTNALNLLSFYVHQDQTHTRKGSYTGKQEPLADSAQSAEWRAAKLLLERYDFPIPKSGVLLDG